MELVPGDCVLIMPHTSHCLSLPENCFVYQVAVRECTLHNLNESFFASCQKLPACSGVFEAEGDAFLLFHTGVEPEIRSLMEQMVEECENPHRLFNVMLQDMLSSLLSLLLNEFEPEPEQREDAPDLERLSWYLQTHLATVTLSSAAAHFGFTPSYFSTLVRQKTGQNFSTILRELRMSMACQMLAKTDATLRAICEQTGYESVSQFSASFKQKLGMTPREYRRCGGKAPSNRDTVRGGME
jgi:AraC-like DNA-binding protein